VILKPLFIVLTAVLAVLLLWNIGVALRAESLLVAGPRLAADPWGWVTIIDVYLGFVVFAGYLCVREGRASRALPWLAAIAVLGNVATAAYVLWVLWRARWDAGALVRPAGR
jgi:hypothetical protein